jgi:pimeloyl-ACP methyl ester carboxylesterase
VAHFAEAVKLPAALIYAPGNHPKASLVDEAGNRAPAVQIAISEGQAPEDKPSTAPNGAGVQAGAKPENKPVVKVETLKYASSLDKTGPLLADVAMVPDGKPKPLLVVMHGFGGSKADVAQDLRELAGKGLVAVAPDMRGRGSSAGKWDCGGLDVHDILDAVMETVRKYPQEIDARNLNIVGYSGGGGNAIACAVRFPDLFRTCISFFGISDYGWWHRSKGGGADRNATMEKVLGGAPDAVPEVYEARNATAAAGNALAKLHFFWDAEETICPPQMTRDFLDSYRKAGRSEASDHVSKPGDTKRWRHGYRAGNADLGAADEIFLKDVLAPKAAPPELPKTGKLVVNGYLVTRRFAVWVEDSKKGPVKGRVTVEYDLTGAKPVVKVVENPKNYKVSIEESPLAGLL